MSEPSPLRITEVVDSRGVTVYEVSGPDGHEALLRRETYQAALDAGAEYWERTREMRAGEWVLR